MTRRITTICPHCGYEHDATTAVVERGHAGLEPRMGPGDYTLCFGCGEFCVMDRTGMLRRPTHTEVRKIRRDKLCQMVRENWLAFRATRQ